MVTMQKRFALPVILVLTLLSLILVNSASAQTQTQLPVPEFALQIADHSYDVAPTFTIDPYTGQNQTASDGYHVEKRFINVVITNPNSTSFTDANGNVVKLYYNVRERGHFYQDWTNYDPTADSNLAPTDTQFTTIPYGFGNENPGGFSIFLGYIAPGGMVDFQVQAIEGYYTQVQTNSSDGYCWRIQEYNVFAQTGTSGWSSTQTITVDPPPTPTPEPTPTHSPLTTLTAKPSPSPIVSNSPPFTPTLTPSPLVNLSNSGLTSIAIVAVAAVSAIVIAAILRWKKKSKTTKTDSHEVQESRAKSQIS
jgi:hypothetical protein